MGAHLVDILIGCEESGTLRDEFNKLGHNAISVDILATSAPGPHIRGDILPLLDYAWDMAIFFPPCTYLCNSGVCHLTNKDGSRNIDRWENMAAAVKFFNALKNSDIPRICIENPIPHKYGLGKTYSQIIQPYQFGHPERKATCLWLKGLPKLVETNNVKEKMLKLPKNKSQRLHYMSPGPERAKLRSKTFPGIAKAMAEQWGAL